MSTYFYAHSSPHCEEVDRYRMMNHSMYVCVCVCWHIQKSLTGLNMMTEEIIITEAHTHVRMNCAGVQCAPGYLWLVRNSGKCYLFARVDFLTLIIQYACQIIDNILHI